MKKIHLSAIVLFILAAALIGAWAIGIDELFPPPWPDAPLALQGPAPEDALPFTDSISAESCSKCHEKQNKEWEEWVRYGPPHEGETEEDASQIHQVRFVEDYENAEFCAKCHQEELHHIPGTPMEIIPPGETVVWDNTYGEWQAWQESLPEDHTAKGAQCQTCHMPHAEHT
jgi:hypothetical protein